MIKCRRLRWKWHIIEMENDVGTFKILTGRSIGNRLAGGPRRLREDKIVIDL